TWQHLAEARSLSNGVCQDPPLLPVWSDKPFPGSAVIGKLTAGIEKAIRIQLVRRIEDSGGWRLEWY
ncbi:MAG: hypothetical protein ABSG56_39300, partial [Bryobacteraceae bacterium]